MDAFKKLRRVAEIRAQLAPDTPVEVWFQDEMRVGQKNKLTYRWARKGSRPPAAHDQRTQSTYLFGAGCPEGGAGSAFGANRTEQVGRLGPLIMGSRGARAFPGPAVGQLILLTHPHLVLEPDL